MKRVPLWRSQGFINIDERATYGATIGTNVFNADGSLYEPATASEDPSSPVSRTLWSLVMEIPANVTALEDATGSTGLFAVTGAGTGAFRTLQPTVGRTTVSNGDGVAGDPVVDLAVLADSGTGTALVKITRDTFGRVSGTQSATTDDLSEGASNLYFTDARARSAVVTASITDADTTHAPSGDAVFDALAGKEPAITAGTTAQFLRGDKGWSDTLEGPFYVQLDGTVSHFAHVADAYHNDGAPGQFVSRKARGSLSSPSAVLTGDVIATIQGRGWHSGGDFGGNVADFQFLAAENFTSTAQGTYWRLRLTPTGSVTNSEALLVDSSRHFTPGADNTQQCGSASLRWKEVFAGTGTINTCDAREKTAPRDLAEPEYLAALDIARLPCIFQWLQAIESKGDAARLHASPTVQSVIAAMQAHGLDPFRYGFVCYDAWSETPEVRDAETGEVTQEYRPAGDRYSLRPSELAAFIMRAIVKRQDEIEGRLTAIGG